MPSTRRERSSEGMRDMDEGIAEKCIMEAIYFRADEPVLRVGMDPVDSEWNEPKVSHHL